jgi:hypothetical protein
MSAAGPTRHISRVERQTFTLASPQSYCRRSRRNGSVMRPATESQTTLARNFSNTPQLRPHHTQEKDCFSPMNRHHCLLSPHDDQVARRLPSTTISHAHQYHCYGRPHCSQRVLPVRQAGPGDSHSDLRVYFVIRRASQTRQRCSPLSRNSRESSRSLSLAALALRPRPSRSHFDVSTPLF